MKLLTPLLVIASLVTTCAANGRLFVASTSGNITTLDVVHGSHGTSLAVLASTSGCGPTPSWLELDSKTSTLYCTNEGVNGGSASISSFRVEDDGSLVLNSMLDTPFGGVSSAIYGNGSAIAIAHFNDMLTTVALTKFNELTILTSTNVTTNFSTPARLHQILLDPTENYLFVPAHGTDQVHWFEIDHVTYNLAHMGHLTLDAGSKPRHGVFYSPPGSDGSIVYYYVVTEGTNKIHGFEITYNVQKKIVDTKIVYNETTFADAVPDNVYAAEILISSDNKFLLVSSRNDSRSVTDHIDPTTNATLPTTVSDTIISFALSPKNGTLTVVSTGRRQAGGRWPRHFSLNRAGDLVAAGLQKDHKVALIKRDVHTGLMENTVVSNIVLDGEINAVIWDEDDDDIVIGGGMAAGPVQNGTYTWSGYGASGRPATTLITSTIVGSSAVGVGGAHAASLAPYSTPAVSTVEVSGISSPYYPYPTTAVATIEITASLPPNYSLFPTTIVPTLQPSATFQPAPSNPYPYPTTAVDTVEITASLPLNYSLFPTTIVPTIQAPTISPTSPFNPYPYPTTAVATIEITGTSFRLDQFPTTIVPVVEPLTITVVPLPATAMAVGGGQFPGGENGENYYR